MSVSRLLFRSLLGLVATGTVVHTAVHSAPTEAASSSNENAVFGKFAALGEADTESRLKELTASDETYKTLQTLNKALISGASAKEIEKTLLGLVEKATTDEAHYTLSAILLDYYETNLRDDLTSGALTPAEVFKELDAHNDTLTEATYGSSWRSNKTARKLHVRR